jgi:tRNA dimethylallyltransferase
VGYKEMVDHLEGRRTLEETVSLIKQHSRNYAKRQMTWWRKEPDIHWFDPGQIAEISDFVHRELYT